MPWKECKPMDERLRFVARLLDGREDGAEEGVGASVVLHGYATPIFKMPSHLAIILLATKHGRYGYLLITVLRHEKGWNANAKR